MRTERKKKKTHLFQDEERQMAEDIFGMLTFLADFYFSVPNVMRAITCLITAHLPALLHPQHHDIL